MYIWKLPKKSQTYLQVRQQEVVPYCGRQNMKALLGPGEQSLQIWSPRIWTILFLTLTFRCSVSVFEYFRAFSFFSLNSLRYSKDWHRRLANGKGQLIYQRSRLRLYLHKQLLHGARAQDGLMWTDLGTRSMTLTLRQNWKMCSYGTHPVVHTLTGGRDQGLVFCLLTFKNQNLTHEIPTCHYDTCIKKKKKNHWGAESLDQIINISY